MFQSALNEILQWKNRKNQLEINNSKTVDTASIMRGLEGKKI